MIVSKNFFGVEELLDHFTVSEPLKEIFIRLPELLGDFSESALYIKKRTKSSRVLQALERLQKVEEILALYGVSDYITVDFSMLSQYSYYTGIIFRAYTYGNGEALATGGRYDGLVEQFGKKAAAIGLAIVIDQLLIARSRQKLFPDETLGGTVFLYPQSLRRQALRLTEEYRKQGKQIQMLRKSSRKDFGVYQAYAERMGIDTILYLVSESELIQYDVVTGNEEHRKP